MSNYTSSPIEESLGTVRCNAIR